MLRRRWPIAVFAAWSAYVWVTRILNAWAPSSEETTSAKVISTVSAGALLVGVVVAVAILVSARSRSFRPGEAVALRVFAGLTVAVWAIRVPQILLDADHDAAFKVVHTVLAVISVVLAGLTWQRAGSEADQPADAAGPPAGTTAVSPAANAGR